MPTYPAWVRAHDRWMAPRIATQALRLSDATGLAREDGVWAPGELTPPPQPPIRLALDDAGVARIAELNTQFADEMGRAAPDGAKLIALNKALHFAVYEGARMPTLMKMIEALWLRIGPILNYDLRSGSRRVGDGVAAAHHARLVEALKRHDGAAAREALRGDIEAAADFIVSAGVLVTADEAGLGAGAASFGAGDFFSSPLAVLMTLGAASMTSPQGTIFSAVIQGMAMAYSTSLAKSARRERSPRANWMWPPCCQPLKRSTT